MYILGINIKFIFKLKRQSKSEPYSPTYQSDISWLYIGQYYKYRQIYIKNDMIPFLVSTDPKSDVLGGEWYTTRYNIYQ